MPRPAIDELPAVAVIGQLSVMATFASLFAGRWYDRAGPRVVFATGAVVYVICYGLFSAGIHSAIAVVLAFAAAGAGIGLAEPTESAVVAQLLTDRLRGSGFGVLGAVQAAGDVVATVVAGLLYALISPAAAFGYAAFWMIAAATALGTLRRSANGQPRGRFS